MSINSHKGQGNVAKEGRSFTGTSGILSREIGFTNRKNRIGNKQGFYKEKQPGVGKR